MDSDIKDLLLYIISKQIRVEATCDLLFVAHDAKPDSMRPPAQGSLEANLRAALNQTHSRAIVSKLQNFSQQFPQYAKCVQDHLLIDKPDFS